jgi:hypothetical protein
MERALGLFPLLGDPVGRRAVEPPGERLCTAGRISPLAARISS